MSNGGVVTHVGLKHGARGGLDRCEHRGVEALAQAVQHDAVAFKGDVAAGIAANGAHAHLEAFVDQAGAQHQGVFQHTVGGTDAAKHDGVAQVDALVDGDVAFDDHASGVHAVLQAGQGLQRVVAAVE